MIERTHIKDLKDHTDKSVSIAGFAHTIRDQNKIIFLLVRDVTGIVQTVVKTGSDAFDTAKKLTTESVVRVSGMVKEEKQAPGGYELSVETLEVLSEADASLPIPVVEEKGADKTNAAAQFDYRWLSLRRPEQTRVFKVWTALERGFRNYFEREGFIQFYSPSFMSTASETGAEVFEVDYFDRKAYLAQSPQFYKQMAIASGFEKVFAVGPVFRAELSFTSRHLTEFTGWDFEVGFVESHHDVMDVEEGMIVEGFKALKDVFPEFDIEVPTQPFPRMSMQEVKERLQKVGIESEQEHDISPEEERGIYEIVKKETGHDFLFVTDYHISKRPFYHMRHEDNPKLTKSADLLYKGLEITTLAQREHRVDVLEAQAKEKGMDLEELQDYFNFFRYGCPPHGGGGIGPARIVMGILGIDNVREATYLPRDVKRLRP